VLVARGRRKEGASGENGRGRMEWDAEGMILVSHAAASSLVTAVARLSLSVLAPLGEERGEKERRNKER
jgi:hypothetical protein